ncbi:hypothetical protein ACSMXN_06920 [Jatrophihabitans sp. DSM 45814]
MIDIVDALDLLKSCVRDRGADYRARPRRGQRGSRRARYYECRPGSNSIVGLALIKADVSAATATLLTNCSVGEAIASGSAPKEFTLGAVVTLRAAQTMERRGHDWGSCLQAGVQAAARFIELIPDSAL